MMICLCHPFSDKSVKDFLNGRKKTRVGEVYSACSEGNQPKCCTCLEALKDMVKSHNNETASA